MKARPGDTILIESERVSSPPRTGQIREVLDAAWGTRYRVVWDDGHETTIRPVAGTARVRRPGGRVRGWQVLG